MIGTLPIKAPLATSLSIPTRGAGPLPGKTFIVGKYGSTAPKAPAIQAQAVIPTELAYVPAKPPMPSSRPIVQAGRPIPALPPSAARTSLAPAWAARAPGPSRVSVEPPNDARLPAPLPFGTAATSSPIYPPSVMVGSGLDLEYPDRYSEPEPVPSSPVVTTPKTSTPAASVSSQSGAVPSWLYAVAGVAGVALVGGVAFGAYRRFGKGRR